MKRLYLLILLGFIFIVSSCNNNINNEEPVYNIEGTPFRLSSIVDETNENGIKNYAVIAPYTDEYEITCTKTSKLIIYDENKVIAEGIDEIKVELVKGQTYGLRVETNGVKCDFKVHTTPLNNQITLPYDVLEAQDVSNITINDKNVSPLTAAKIDYQKREGGNYIYSNNPELIPKDSVGSAFIKNKGLTGDVFFTFEHANYSGKPFYLGYQLKNDGEDDVYITVTNIGFQAGGTWFGQYAWFDFYNTSFTLPEEYISNQGAYSNYDYAYQKYSPRIFKPTTYRLPAGEYFYVIGGTTSDAYKNINVDKSADKLLEPNRCSNGNVKFTVYGGEVTGTFYCYDDVNQVKSEPAQTGYRTGNYYAQYSGIANHAGVIDNYSTWIFNDKTESCNLPVSYSNVYADTLPNVAMPYEEYNNTTHEVSNVSSWMTHLNPQNDHRAVGMDIVEFNWVNSFGEPVVIDNLHADGGGRPANTANWMIEYQDHFTFINQGDISRNVTLYLKDGGTLAIMLRDSKTGEVMSTYYTMGQAKLNYTKTLIVPANSTLQVTLQYVLVACSYGNVNHWITLE